MSQQDNYWQNAAAAYGQQGPGQFERWWENQPKPTRHFWVKLSEDAVCGASIMVRKDGQFVGTSGAHATTELEHVDCVKCLRRLAATAMEPSNG